MYNSDTELLFPSRVIPKLRDLRHKPWRELVDRVADTEQDDPDHLAFVLMMVELDGCNTCSSDSFRAMRGCTQCASQNVRRFREPDKELVKMFNQARRVISIAGISPKKNK